MLRLYSQPRQVAAAKFHHNTSDKIQRISEKSFTRSKNPWLLLQYFPTAHCHAALSLLPYKFRPPFSGTAPPRLASLGPLLAWRPPRARNPHLFFFAASDATLRFSIIHPPPITILPTSPSSLRYRTSTVHRTEPIYAIYRQHVEPTNGPRHAGRVPGALPGQAGPARGHQGVQAGPPPQEADPGAAEKGRDAKSLPKGQGAAVEAGARAADGPDGRHGRAVGRADPGQQFHEPHDAHDGLVVQGDECSAKEYESRKGASLSFLQSCPKAASKKERVANEGK